MIGIPFLSLWGIANPSFQALMSRRIDAGEQGQLQGALGSIRALTGMIGPLLFTQVFATAVQHGGQPVLGAPFILAGVLLGVALLVGIQVLPRAASARQGPPG
jgi:DHA1 family tetracycline resistance protein-like MFS transporter